MSKKIIVNCETGGKIYIDLTPIENARREIDRADNEIKETAFREKFELNKKINDEMKAMAIQNLINKGEL